MFTETFKNNIIHSFPNGAEWLQQLPERITKCEQRWKLRIGPPFKLSFNYVAPAIQEDRTEIVIKIGVPHREFFTEIESLRLYDGRGIARLLAADMDWGVLLLERLLPGVMLAELVPTNDDEATKIAGNVMQQLWQPVPKIHNLISIDDWTKDLKTLRPHFDGGTGPFPQKLVEQAETLLAQLIPSQTNLKILHGDLHHDNILSATREPWLAIDPKGIIGEPEFEVVSLLRNPLENILTFPNPKKVIERRISILTEMLGINRERVLSWSVAFGVVSAWWCYDEKDLTYANIQHDIRCSEIASELLSE